MLFSELRCKEVINTRDCKRLGKITDFEFDERTGTICKVFVPGNSHFTNWFSCAEADYEIPYKSICQIGPDIILVECAIPK